MGPSIKYVTLEGEGVREGVTVCDRGRGPRACDVYAYKFVYHTYETRNFKLCFTFCCNTCILTEEGTDKKHPDNFNLFGRKERQKHVKIHGTL